jgi:heparosan-N-sulfate-glucuronate 5-epimerase
LGRLNIKKIYYDLRSYLFGSDAFKFVYEAKNYEYPIDYSFIFRNEKFYFPLKDDSGIPYRLIGREHHYIPSGVAGSALAYYSRYCKEKKLSDRALFIRHAEWFLNFHDGLFPYGFKVLSIDPPWYSCLSQGLAVSVLIRAYKLTGNNLYLDAAKNLFITSYRAIRLIFLVILKEKFFWRSTLRKIQNMCLMVLCRH